MNNQNELISRINELRSAANEIGMNLTDPYRASVALTGLQTLLRSFENYIKQTATEDMNH